MSRKSRVTMLHKVELRLQCLKSLSLHNISVPFYRERLLRQIKYSKSTHQHSIKVKTGGRCIKIKGPCSSKISCQLGNLKSLSTRVKGSCGWGVYRDCVGRGCSRHKPQLLHHHRIGLIKAAKDSVATIVPVTNL